MHSKLLELLQSFDESELLKLNKFVHSPYFNESQQLIDLCEFVLSFKPDFENKKLTYENAFKYIFPLQSYQKSNILKLTSKLFKLIENFVSHQIYVREPLQLKIDQLAYYTAKSCEKNFQAKYHELSQELSANSYKNPKELYHTYTFQKLYANYLSKSDNREGDINLQSINDAFNQYYFTQKLKDLCHINNRQLVVKIEYQHVFEEEIISMLQKSAYLTKSSIAVWYHALLLLKEVNIKDYNKLKELLQTYLTQIYSADCRLLYILLENSAQRLFPIPEMYAELFGLYEEQLENRVMYEQGYLLHSVIKNIITVALRLQRFEWAADFLTNHRTNILPLEFQNDAYLYNLANVLFHKQQYTEITRLLEESSVKDLFYKLSTKVILAKTLYEQKRLDELEQHLQNLQVFIFRTKGKVTALNTDYYKNFASRLQKLVRIISEDFDSLQKFENEKTLKDRNSRQKLRRLIKSIEKESFVSEKAWLIERVRKML